MASATETKWWHTDAASGKVVCTLCPRECHIPEGGRGFCFVRANEGGRLVLTTYGRSSGFCVDPIEKKPLSHFLPGTPVLSLGTAGCNLGCKFCQNWDISKSREMDTLSGRAGPEAIIEACKATGSRSVAFTYNDPVIWAEYAIDIAKVARREGIKTVAVTAGYISPEPRAEFYEWMDAANVDLKAFTDTFYRKLCQTRLQPVLDTIRYLKHETGVWQELTTLLIPGENDSLDEIKQMSDWILEAIGDEVPIHFTAFHPDFKMMDKPRTPHETLIAARQVALDRGIKYAYVGNVHDKERQSTYCHGCGQRVIGRDWHELSEYHLDGNRCRSCGTVIPGVFERGPGVPGQWGRKRLPIRIQDSGATATVTLRTPRDRNTMNTATDTEQPRIDFNESQQRAILEFARDVVNATVLNRPVGAELPQEVSQAATYGVFVTLKRGDRLRACLGRWGFPLAPLQQVVRDMAASAAINDHRFPSIGPQELDYLELDVSLMHSPAEIEQRVESVQVGRHGLVLTHPRGRGLFLPNVATENHWDALTFLQQLGRKAGLDTEAWRQPHSQLMTFETCMLSQPPANRELHPESLDVKLREELLDVANGTATQEPALLEKHDYELGMIVATASGKRATIAGSGHSLADLAGIAVSSLRKITADEKVASWVLLYQPVQVRPEQYPQRTRSLAGCAVVARGPGGQWSLTAGQDPVAEAVGAIRAPLPEVRLTAFLTNTHTSLHSRPPARAGQFYPGDPQTMQSEAARFLGAVSQSKPVRAVMLPHAGWRFCGETIGRTLRDVPVPDTVIILGPRHTPHGPPMSVAPHRAWEIPGGHVPIATEIAERLARLVPGMKLEPEAHRLEHGSEVLLPFLQMKNPSVRVVPVVLGRVNEDDLRAVASALAQLMRENPRLLLVISSDMNHYAPEAENRRKDGLALEAMRTGKPDELLNVCRDFEISMCGVVPAAAVMKALIELDPSSPLATEQLDYRTSADATGDQSSVVGYAGMVIA